MNLTAMETAKLFSVSREAVRSYCLEFDVYLSPVARPQKGRQRMFTPSDLEVIGLIVELKAEGKLFTDIHAALSNGQRGGVPDTQTSITPAQPNALAILSQRIDTLEAEVSRLRTADAQLQLVKEQNAALMDEIKALNREIGKLMGKLEG